MRAAVEADSMTAPDVILSAAALEATKLVE
jgi:hypothetical protein